MGEELSLRPISRRPSSSLHQASRDDNDNVVGELLSFPEMIEALDSHDKLGYTPLHYAAKFNRIDTLKKLLDAGANPDIRSRDERYTALHFTANYLSSTEEEIKIAEVEPDSDIQSSSVVCAVKILLDRRADIMICDSEGSTILHLACRRGNLRFVKKILPYYYELMDVLTVKNSNNENAIHEACRSGRLEIVKELIDSAISVSADAPAQLLLAVNLEDKTPLHIACQEGHVEITNYILQKITEHGKNQQVLLEMQDSDKNMPIHLACESGKFEIVESLIIAHCRISEDLNEAGLTPLHIAVCHGHVKVVKLLIDGLTLAGGITIRGINVNIVDSFHCTPLHHAARHNQTTVMRILTRKNANLSALDENHYTPLMLATYKGNIRAFEALLKLKATIDDRDSKGRTIVHVVAEEGYVDLLELILRHRDGQELSKSIDSQSNTPLHLAAKKGNTECVKILLKGHHVVDVKNGLKQNPMHYAASEGHVEVMSTLIKNQKDCVTALDYRGNSPLHLAAANGHYQATKLLVDNKANGETRNVFQRTPMDEAAYKGHAKIVQLLLDSEAVPKYKKKTSTPLHLAAQEGHLEVVTILLKNGAELGVQDALGNGPLDLAIKYDHENIAMAIVKNDRWKDALRHTSDYQGKTTTPLRRLIERMPVVAKEVFNRCSSRVDDRGNDQRHLESPSMKVCFDYEFLEDMKDKPGLFSQLMNGISRKKSRVQDLMLHDTQWGPHFSKDIHPLSIMVEHSRIELLKHPLVSSLLSLKWSIYGLLTYLLNLLVYTLFVAFLTSFALLSPNPQSRTCHAIAAGTFGQSSSEEVMYLWNTSWCDLATTNISEGLMGSFLAGVDVCSSSEDRERCGATDEDCGRCEQSTFQRGFLIIAAAIVIGFAGVRISFETFQLISLGYHYLKDWVNYVELTLFACSIIFSFVFTDPCLCPTSWQWQIGCVAVFLAWIDFIIFIGKLPLTGIYILMLIDIFKTFCKLFLLTMLLLVAFALAFYMAFDDLNPGFVRSSFATPGRSLLKIMTMTTGEFEYDTVFRQFPGGAEEGQNTSEVPFFPVSVILWIIFLILMPILLTNLLIGLAVDDIQGIQTAAELKRLSLQVELALSVEEAMPVCLRRNFSKRKQTLEINQNLSPSKFLQKTFFGSGSDCFDSPENFHKSLHPPMETIEQIQSSTEDMLAEMKQMNHALQQVEQMKSTMLEMQEMMKKITSANSEMSSELATLKRTPSSRFNRTRT